MLDPDAAALHQKVMEERHGYDITASWNPVLLGPDGYQQRACLHWLNERLGERAMRLTDCVWSHCEPRFFIIKDPVVAVEFKLIFG